jgi:hypothetical protein
MYCGLRVDTVPTVCTSTAVCSLRTIRSAVAYIPYIVYVHIGWYLFYKEEVREPNEIRNRIGLLRLHGQEPPTIVCIHSG